MISPRMISLATVIGMVGYVEVKVTIKGLTACCGNERPKNRRKGLQEPGLIEQAR
jgi:hypothetical protein